VGCYGTNRDNCAESTELYWLLDLISANHDINTPVKTTDHEYNKGLNSVIIDCEQWHVYLYDEIVMLECRQLILHWHVKAIESPDKSRHSSSCLISKMHLTVSMEPFFN